MARLGEPPPFRISPAAAPSARGAQHKAVTGTGDIERVTVPSHDEFIAECARCFTDRSTIERMWERAGGKRYDIPTAGTARNIWWELGRKAQSGAVPIDTLHLVALAELPRNNVFKALECVATSTVRALPQPPTDSEIVDALERLPCSGTFSGRSTLVGGVRGLSRSEYETKRVDLGMIVLQMRQLNGAEGVRRVLASAALMVRGTPLASQLDEMKQRVR